MIRDAMLNRTEAEWDALEDAIGTINGFEAGHVLTEDEVQGLRLMDRCHREDEETATDAYHSGHEDGLRERGGDELVASEKWLSEREVRAATDRAMRRLAEVRADEFQALLGRVGTLADEGMATGETRDALNDIKWLIRTALDKALNPSAQDTSERSTEPRDEKS